jgi:hypothetical protein
MTQATIDHSTLSRLVEADAVRGASVVGDAAGGWVIMVRYGMQERALAAQRSRQVRRFRKFETLVTYLRELGIAKFDVDAAHYAAQSLLTPKRQDASERMARTHAAAAHDKWFRSQVKEAMDEASNDATKWVDVETAQKQWQQDRSRLLKGTNA